MKRSLEIGIVLTLCILFLGACSGDATVDPQTQPYIKEMLAALTAGDLDASNTILHPDRMSNAAGDGFLKFQFLLSLQGSA